ncbi:hypothetical protein DUNSADRAFT_5447 [Dunaliella salina]|uniref:Uncharacterized protein n=1 Tax=Dunaliella salina TaxID=3046 RepID=A0ABQ7GQ78_DUNSA|nr:hypothetical protein DUNSADRAFT_5447 [Dunaliella salina]|eukprot:KAF5836757.1 hypothetical protein DUNSADRAFT_5447 [Dunaliella salina]
MALGIKLSHIPLAPSPTTVSIPPLRPSPLRASPPASTSTSGSSIRHGSIRQGHSPVRCAATSKPRSEGNFNVNVDPAYIDGASYLKTIGYTNPAEIARILDVAMNPGSMFADYRSGKRATNASARLLSVQDDMEPVVNYLLSKNISKGDVMKVISGHPAVLSYSVQQRLEPFWQYMASLGVQDGRLAEAIIARPSLLGLDVDKNLEKIIDYLKYIETPPEQIVKYLLQSI